jgi:hypothetical protein
MIKSYHKSMYDSRTYIAKLCNLEQFSACCGSRYYEKSGKPCNGLGIALYEGKKFKEGEHLVNTIKHVSTPDGDITLIMRTTW